MVWATAAAAAVSIGVAAYSASKGAPGGGKTSVDFPESTIRLFQDVEAPILSGGIAEQQALISPFLGSFRPETQGFLTQQYGQVPNVALAAARKGAESAGISDLGPLYENVGGLQPEFLSAMKELVLQRGAGLQAIVPAGYGQFLSPSTFVQGGTGGGADSFQTGFQIAGALTNVAQAYVKNY